MFHNSEKIGGPGVTVEIDESKFGKSNVLYFIILYWYCTILILYYKESTIKENE